VRARREAEKHFSRRRRFAIPGHGVPDVLAFPGPVPAVEKIDGRPELVRKSNIFARSE
jgi:hypothetical protein